MNKFSSYCETDLESGITMHVSRCNECGHQTRGSNRFHAELEISNHIKSNHSTPQQEETFDWKTAMKLFAEGVEVEAFVGSSWMSFPYSLHPDLIGFDKTMKYRRKPVTPKPDYSKDQGFVPDDLIMVSNGDSWEFGRYYGFLEGCQYHHMAYVTRHEQDERTYNFKFARKFTKEEYSRVRVEGV